MNKMKKMMFAVIASLFAAVTYAAGVASANIVGYAGSKLRSGARILTPQFVDVGNEKIISLNSIVATGFDSLYNVSIKTLDNVGRKVKEYQWVDYAGESGEELGWYETTDGWVTDVTLSPGDALWVEGSNDAQGFQSSGAVCLKDMFVQLQSGATLCGNPFPITISLDDIYAEGEDSLYNVSIKTLDNVGRKVKEYQWVDYAGESGEKLGWYETTHGWIKGAKVEAGEGLWIEGSNSKQIIAFPAPEMN